tara:strand:- start:613 stop:1431 length:819 start_codon:yes stop_codon:yes gene_type:complete
MEIVNKIQEDHIIIGLNKSIDIDDITKKIIKCQSIVRKYLANKNNIYKFFKNSSIETNFENTLKGYHLINTEAVKESRWEEINRSIVKDTCDISDIANGDHKSGKDNRFNKWNISNKSGKIDNKGAVSISSYRLTSVCNAKNNGIPEDIIKEIEKRELSYDYYSLLLRIEDENKEIIIYKWFIIPKDYYIFNVNKFKLNKKIGKIKRNKGEIVGWESEYYDITFSMSSQLWFKFKLSDIKHYMITEAKVQINNNNEISYAKLYKNKEMFLNI